MATDSMEKLSYLVQVQRVTDRSVCVDIVGLKRNVWLPRGGDKGVDFPEDVERGDALSVKIPRWLIRNETALNL